MPTQGQSNITTDHGEIRRWVEAHGGHPATVKRTARGGGPGLLRIDYPGFSGEDSLEEISWDEFFDKFEESGLAFVYQDRKADGADSRFSKLVRRDGASGGSQTRRGVRPRGSKSNTATRARASSSKTGSDKSGSGRTGSAKAKRAPRAGTAKSAGGATGTSKGRSTPRATSRSKASAGRTQAGQRRSAKTGSKSRSSRSSSRSSARSRET
jgi:hypothetical protein